MARDPKTLVSNGGKSRAGEKRKNPRKESDRNRAGEKSSKTPKKRKLESLKRSVNRKLDNLERVKNGLYECTHCRIVKPESLFPQHVPTSGKFSRYESCGKCLDAQKEMRVHTGVTQQNRDRNATRSLATQQSIKVSLQDKPGYDEYRAECDAANPPKKTAQRLTKEEMEEKFPLVQHG